MEETSKVTKSRVHHGFNISIARNRKGLKQAALADMLGISQQRLSQLESQRGSQGRDTREGIRGNRRFRRRFKDD